MNGAQQILVFSNFLPQIVFRDCWLWTLWIVNGWSFFLVNGSRLDASLDTIWWLLCEPSEKNESASRRNNINKKIIKRLNRLKRIVKKKKVNEYASMDRLRKTRSSDFDDCSSLLGFLVSTIHMNECECLLPWSRFKAFHWPVILRWRCWFVRIFNELMGDWKWRHL